jgi:hypothetical protein
MSDEEKTKGAEPAKQSTDADAKQAKLDALFERLKRDPAFHVVESTTHEQYAEQLRADPRFHLVKGTGEGFIFMVNGPVALKKPED